MRRYYGTHTCRPYATVHLRVCLVPDVRLRASLTCFDPRFLHTHKDRQWPIHRALWHLCCRAVVAEHVLGVCKKVGQVACTTPWPIPLPCMRIRAKLPTHVRHSCQLDGHHDTADSASTHNYISFLDPGLHNVPRYYTLIPCHDESSQPAHTDYRSLGAQQHSMSTGPASCWVPQPSAEGPKRPRLTTE